MTVVKVVDHPPYLNIFQFLQIQSHERYKAFVLHAPPLQGKTSFARKLCAAYPGGVYLDLLQEVVNQPELAHHLDELDVQTTRDLVLSYAYTTQAQLLLVDELDFLVHTWPDNLLSFKRMIQWLYGPHLPTCIGFILQTRPVLEEWQLIATTGQNRILRLEEVFQLSPS